MAEVDKAGVLARFLMTWHQTYGVGIVEERASDHDQQAYRAALAEHLQQDMSRESVIRRVAQDQVSGIFEMLYAFEPDAGLWATIVGAPYPALDRPAALGLVGKLMLELLSQSGSDPVRGYALPAAWQEDAGLPLDVVQLTLPGGRDRVRLLREYFGGLAELQRWGLGGSEFLITMNEDLRADLTDAPEHVKVFGPASLGFQLATGERTVVTDVLDGLIAVDDVVLGE